MIPPRKKMTYQQARAMYGISPYGDTDNDGVVNINDCRPLNPNEQGIFKRAVGKLTKDKYGQTAEEYKQEKLEKAIRKAQLADLEAQAAASGQPLQKTGPTQSAKQWLERQAHKDINLPQGTLSRIAKPVQRVGQTVSPYVTGEQWPEPPLMQSREVYPQDPYIRREGNLRYRVQPGWAYGNRKGYASRGPSREPIINIFKDAPSPRPQNPFRKRRRRY